VVFAIGLQLGHVSFPHPTAALSGFFVSKVCFQSYPHTPILYPVRVAVMFSLLHFCSALTKSVGPLSVDLFGGLLVLGLIFAKNTLPPRSLISRTNALVPPRRW